MMSLYESLIRPILSCFGAESNHELFLRIGQIIEKNSRLKNLLSGVWSYPHPILNTKIAGLDFKNPVGLAAGFDKNALLADLLPALGFGFAEIGSVTARPWPGNPKPRLWVLPKDKTILAHYGLPSDGAETVLTRLKNRPRLSISLGVNIAKTADRRLSLKEGLEDYARSFSLFQDTGDYITLNLNCLDFSSGKMFYEPELLELLLERLDEYRTLKPVFLKLKPNTSYSLFDKILAIAEKYPWITGFTIAHLVHLADGPVKTRSKIPEGAAPFGGLSGKPTEKLSNDLLSYAYQCAGKKYILIGCGGIFSGEDAYEKIKRGASLVQLYTGLIYKGPGLVRSINQDLVRLISADGFKNISEAVGAYHH